MRKEHTRHEMLRFFAQLVRAWPQCLGVTVGMHTLQIPAFSAHLNRRRDFGCAHFAVVRTSVTVARRRVTQSTLAHIAQTHIHSFA